LQATPLAPFLLHFTTDDAAPTVVTTSVAEGAVLPVGDLTLTITFSEPMNKSLLAAAGFALLGNFRQVSYAPAAFSFDASGTILTLQYKALPDDAYKLTLTGSGFADLAALNLAHDFVLDFSLDVDRAGAAAFPPAISQPPFGSLVYGPSVTNTIATPTDTDSYALVLDAGQTLTVLVQPDTHLQPTLEVIDPNGNHHTVLGTAPGAATLMQTLAITTAGKYIITIGGAAETSGLYTARLALNAAFEAEEATGAGNDTRATAQSLDGSFIDLGNGASRGAVLGHVGGVANNDVFAVRRTAGNGFGGAIVHLDATGQIVGTISNPELARGYLSDLELGPNNDLYVALDINGNPTTGELVHFGLDGTFLGTIALPSDSPGSFLFPFGFDVAPDGTLWLPQRNSGMLLHLDASGHSLGSYTVGGNPADAVVRSDGLVLVTDSSSNQVLDIDPATGQVGVFALVSTHPRGLTLAPNGDVWVADLGVGAMRFSHLGILRQVIHDSGVAEDVQVDLNGTVLITSATFGTVDRFDSLGNLLGSTSLGGGPAVGLAVAGVDMPITPSGDPDYYSFSLTAGQSITLVLNKTSDVLNASGVSGGQAHFQLLDAAGNILRSSTHVGTNVDEAIGSFVAPATGRYYVLVNGDPYADYNLVITRAAAFDIEDNSSQATAQNLDATGGALGALAGSDQDWYAVNLTFGYKLHLATTTPADGPGLSSNTLDPHIQLYDASGNLLVSGTTLADGRNEALDYIVASSGGTYFIRITAEHATQGEYFLAKTVTQIPFLTPLTTLDNGQAGYRETGANWQTIQTGWNGTSRVHAADGTGLITAVWTLNVKNGLPKGRYDVFVTFVTSPSRATKAEYDIYDGNLDPKHLLGKITVDQTQTPGAGQYQHVLWSDLGIYTFTSGTALIVLDDNAAGSVDADGVLLVPSGSPQLLASGAQSANSRATSVTAAQLQPIIAEAKALWVATGLDRSQQASLANVDFEIANLGGNLLGLTSLQTIWIDDDAAGQGWFIDSTPADNREFQPAGGIWVAVPGSSADGHVDLLTVVAHELGHVLGLPDLDEEADPANLMAETIAPGVRRIPEAQHWVPGGPATTDGAFERQPGFQNGPENGEIGLPLPQADPRAVAIQTAALKEVSSPVSLVVSDQDFVEMVASMLRMTSSAAEGFQQRPSASPVVAEENRSLAGSAGTRPELSQELQLTSESRQSNPASVPAIDALFESIYRPLGSIQLDDILAAPAWYPLPAKGRS
jgi:hypothetical protein